ncbi:MAG: hypothetical protein J1F36_00200 [Clostridiales bacterium]|nr:hypothetical protein [Clostridiales bacterium]
MCFRKKTKNIIRPKPVRSDTFLKIKEIIDKHDPIDLLSYAPPDEYESEVAEIETELTKIANLPKDTIQDIIYDILKRQFEPLLYNENCNLKDVASEIVNILIP